MSKEDMLKADLLSLEPKDFYFKHIVKSHNWYFSDYLHFEPTELVDRMDCFKEIVSKRLDVNFHNIQIVGSAGASNESMIISLTFIFSGIRLLM